MCHTENPHLRFHSRNHDELKTILSNGFRTVLKNGEIRLEKPSNLHYFLCAKESTPINDILGRYVNDTRKSIHQQLMLLEERVNISGEYNEMID